MAGTNEYVKQFGGVSFTERPFGDADNIALCEVFYMHLEDTVSDSFADEPKPFAEACVFPDGTRQISRASAAFL